MHDRRRFLIRSATSALALCASDRAGAEVESIDRSVLQRDVDILQRGYLALHPGLHRYNTRASLDAHLAALRARLARPATLGDAFVAVSTFTASIRCGHTYPNPYNQGRTVRTALFSNRDRLPFLFTWMQGRLIVIDGLGCHPDVRRGTEVVAIGGHPVSSILSTLVPLMRADGSNLQKRIRELDLRGRDPWEAFDLYLPLVFPDVVSGPSTSLDIANPSREGRHEIHVELLTSAMRTARMQVPPEPAQDTPLWTFEHRGDVALLTMPTWGVYKTRWPWESWLNERLDSIAEDGTRTLIVDLRGNEGGQDCGDMIAARLVDRDVGVMPVTRKVRYRKVPDDLLPFVDTWDETFKDWGDQAIGPDAAGFYRLTRWDDSLDGRDIIRPNGRRFRGRAFVLIDAANSSATFQFAQTMKDSRLATLIGETTGGNRRGINGGAFLFLRLPGTRIEVDIPLVGYFPAASQPDAGIEPDIRVARTIDDIASDHDRCLEAALRIAGHAGRDVLVKRVAPGATPRRAGQVVDG